MPLSDGSSLSIKATLTRAYDVDSMRAAIVSMHLPSKQEYNRLLLVIVVVVVVLLIIGRASDDVS